MRECANRRMRKFMNYWHAQPHIRPSAHPQILSFLHYQNFHIPANYFRIFFASNLLYLN